MDQMESTSLGVSVFVALSLCLFPGDSDDKLTLIDWPVCVCVTPAKLAGLAAKQIAGWLADGYT